MNSQARTQTRTQAGTRVRTRFSVGPAVVGAVIGAVTAVIVVGSWHVLLVLFSNHTAAPSLSAVAAVGALLGIWIRSPYLRSTTPQRTLRVLGSALLVTAGWLTATTLRPFGLSSVSGWGIIGTAIVWTVIAFTIHSIFRRVPVTDQIKSDLLYTSVSSLRAAGVLFFTVIAIFPFYFMVASSLKTRAALLQNPANLAIDFSQGIGHVLVGYVEVMTRFNFGRYILNSTFVALFTVIATLIPAILGAYAVTRLRFRGRELLSRSILLIYMFPAIVLVIPLYSVFSQLGLRNTLPGLLIVYPAMTIPVALYMLRSYFLTLPRDIEEAGLIDGCTRFEVIWRITLPLSIPALASVGLYVFMIAWNEFLFAFMFLDSPEIFTLSRGVVALNSQEVPRQFLMAGAVVITVPVMVLFFWFERFLTGGLAAGGVKG
ncbi:MAG: carbohydrate ABC transporter permease [Alkalispirochaeta sp.]